MKCEAWYKILSNFRMQILFLMAIQCLGISVLKADQDFEFSVMVFNVENLFDTKHDLHKEDETFLPLKEKQSDEFRRKCFSIRSPRHRKDCLNLDWNEKVLDRKLSQLAKVILSVEQGKGPDNLILVEVENKNVLDMLNQRYLASAGYKTAVIIEGQDPRGIDVAFLSRFPQKGKAELHEIPFKYRGKRDTGKNKKSRGILDVVVTLPQMSLSENNKIRFLGVHFPSQGNPTYFRSQAIEYLSSLVEARKSEAIIVGGDFNITKREDEKKGLYSKYLGPLGLVSHIDACADCLGSHNYKGQWEFLDVLFFSSSLNKKNWKVDLSSIQVIQEKSVHFLNGKPERFDPIKLIGVSDHLPVYARLKWKK
ncbi:MAG: endonuclease/exonuclease/phosphatase family protein [Bdellovibrionaceae bacterium]|nr:endonuclease/exonuclease/phosphatase family protein [Pseudobdellovibrionaceae bacterium]NUM58035.1 endonuclease/exonuclease/phosphatase family protein [Pseudobdellovibrionaceae bacterium]